MNQDTFTTIAKGILSEAIGDGYADDAHLAALAALPNEIIRCREMLILALVRNIDSECYLQLTKELAAIDGGEI